MPVANQHVNPVFRNILNGFFSANEPPRAPMPHDHHGCNPCNGNCAQGRACPVEPHVEVAK